jgi:CBS domain-containing protein
MIIERDMSRFYVRNDACISDALRKIDENHEGFVVCVDEAGVLEGVVTDGDMRRWLLDQNLADLRTAVGTIANRDCLRVLEGESDEDIRRKLSDRIKFLPLVDARQRLIGLVRRRSLTEGIRIGKRLIYDESPVFVIAEIGIGQ